MMEGIWFLSYLTEKKYPLNTMKIKGSYIFGNLYDIRDLAYTLLLVSSVKTYVSVTQTSFDSQLVFLELKRVS